MSERERSILGELEQQVRAGRADRRITELALVFVAGVGALVAGVATRVAVAEAVLGVCGFVLVVLSLRGATRLVQARLLVRPVRRVPAPGRFARRWWPM